MIDTARLNDKNRISVTIKQCIIHSKGMAMNNTANVGRSSANITTQAKAHLLKFGIISHKSHSSKDHTTSE